MTIRVEFRKTDGSEVPVGFLNSLPGDIQAVFDWYVKKYNLGADVAKSIKYQDRYFKYSAVLIIKTPKTFDTDSVADLAGARKAKLVMTVEEVVADYIATETSLCFQETDIPSQYPYVRTCVPRTTYQATISCSQAVDLSSET